MLRVQKGDWKEYRKLPDQLEVDFHRSGVDGRNTHGSYQYNMELVYADAIESLKKAHAEGKQSVLFTHGCSTSRIGQTTSRSQVRKAMRSKEATPYILRPKCIQHDSVFVAIIRPKKP